jgi:nucleolin
MSLKGHTRILTSSTMATKATKKAADRKRQRDEESSSSSEEGGGSSGSDSESESESEPQQKPPAAEKKTAAADSDDDSDDDDSSDDETENALFRPATVAKEDGGEDDETSSDEEEEEEEEEEAKKQARVKKETKETKAEPSASKKKPEASNPLSKELEDEVARKTEATVYIEGIPYKANESDIVTHFAACGTVKEVRMPRYQDSGKPRGYAHVVFDAASAISKALKLDGKYLFGRYLTVKQAQRPRTLETALQEQKSVKKAVKGCKTVFVKHLPYDVEEAAVKEALASCGTIVSVRLPLWNHTKKLKGFGYVEFSTEDEAVAAVRRSGMKIGDRMVIISLETVASAPKASFRTTDGRFWRKGDEAKSSLVTKLTEKTKRSSKPDHKAKKHKTK